MLVDLLLFFDYRIHREEKVSERKDFLLLLGLIKVY